MGWLATFACGRWDSAKCLQLQGGCLEKKDGEQITKAKVSFSTRGQRHHCITTQAVITCHLSSAVPRWHFALLTAPSRHMLPTVHPPSCTASWNPTHGRLAAKPHRNQLPTIAAAWHDQAGRPYQGMSCKGQQHPSTHMTNRYLTKGALTL